MIKNILFGLVLILALSCVMDDDNDILKQENGSIWISGGLMNCAHQIRLDDGVTLIGSLEDIGSFTSGDKVRVIYKEIGINEFCSPAIDCEIIEIFKID